MGLMSAKWCPPIDAGHGRGEVVRSPRGLHLRLPVLTSGRRLCRPAAEGLGGAPPRAPYGSVPPAHRSSVAVGGPPGNPPVRELGQKAEAAELIAGWPRCRDSGDRISRLERPAAECRLGSAAKDPGGVRGRGMESSGCSRPRRQTGRRLQPVALRPGQVMSFGPTPKQSGSCSGTLADPIGSLEETHAAGWLSQGLRKLSHSALPVVDETGCHSRRLPWTRSHGSGR